MAEPSAGLPSPEGTVQTQPIRAGTGRSVSRDTVQAATEASIAAMAHLNATSTGTGCDLALVLSSGCHSEAPGIVSRIVARATGARNISGCSGAMLFTDQGLLEERHGIVVLVVRGLQPTAATWPSLALDPSGAGRGLSKALARGPKESQEEGGIRGPILTLVDPRSLRARLFLGALRDGLPPGTPVLGGGASVEDGEAWVLAQSMEGDPDALVGAEDAVAGMCLNGCSAAWGITQSFQTISEVMEVTKIEGDCLFELNGKPALSTLLELVPDELACNPVALRQDCILGFPLLGPDHRQHLRPIYIGQARGQSLQISKRLKQGDKVLLAQRDPQLAARDLRDMMNSLRRRAPQRPAFGIFINSCDRGDQLFDQPDLGIRAVQETWPDLPFLGWHTPRQLASMEGEPQALVSGAVMTIFG